MHAETRHGSRVIVFLAVAAALLLAQPGQAQYFGRNKVRYAELDFQVLKTPHFDIYYYPEEQAAVEQAARMAERWYTRLSKLLNHQFARRQPIVLYANHTHFEQTNTIDEVGEGTGGVTEALKRRVVMPFAGPMAETDHVLGHELVHAFQYDVTSDRGGLPGALTLPLWFIEGMAEYLSVGPVDSNTAMWIRDSAKRNKLPTFRQLGDPRFFPYRYGHALWSYVAGRWGDRAVGQILKAAGRSGDAERAFQEVLGVDAKVLVDNWHESIRQAYGPFLEKPDASRYGRALITERNAGDLNVGPALSPDGRRLVFLSEKSLFAIEMYLADAETGRIIRKIVKTSVDPHFESLQFIDSSGDWDATGRRFVFAAVSKGKPVLSILNVDTGRIQREVSLSQVGEIHDPAWSPDGRQVAFSGNVGGLIDLFVYDLSAGSLRRLTDDAFAELQPAWSPDGRRLAFVTDRFTSRLDDLSFGDYRMALMDVASGTVTEAPGFENAKNIDPHFSADGRSLYFLSDQNGITNIYRLELSSGQRFQVTNLVTGVSGITALAPALSVGGSRVAFSVYEEGKHRIYQASSPEVLLGGPVVSEGRRAAELPPFDRGRDEVLALQSNPTLGLPERRRFETTSYKPKLSLDYIGGQTSVGVAGDPRGAAYNTGGVTLMFSDMLGNHNVGAVVQSTGDIRDLGGLVAYQNRKSRWDWGGAVQQIPYLSGSFAEGISAENPDVFIQQARIFRETDRAAIAFAAYPFSRVHRFEFGAALRQISFSIEQETQAFSLRTGQLILDERQKLPAPDGVTLVEPSAALVYDSSVFGATSPILGRRYRLEVSPTFGTVKFTGVLADVRQYVMPVRPYTIAARVVHYGRYGSGDQSRLAPLYVGYPTLVRGYDVNSFAAGECGPTTDGSCPVFDQLLGTRLLVANIELRFPLVGALGGRRLYGPIPIELFGFADTGMAWTGDDRVNLFGGARASGERRRVSSVGAGARINVLGYAVLEIGYVHPLDRPQKRWLWQFNLAPGF